MTSESRYRFQKIYFKKKQVVDVNQKTKQCGIDGTFH